MAEPDAKTLDESRAFCAAEVRRADHDRYLTAMFAPAASRPKLLALYAFNQEIAKVRETVTDPVLGQIRLQWWRETIDGLYAGEARAHPVAQALAAAMGEGADRPDRAHFERLIDGRELDLAGHAPATLADLEAYCIDTSSCLLWLAAGMLGARDDATRRALAPLGVAWALTGLIRAVPFHAGRRRRFVPDDICRQAALSESALFDGSGGFDGRGGEALARALAALAAAARRHLGQAQADAGAVASEARPLLLFAALTGAYLDRLARRGHDVYAAGVAIPPASKVVRLWWAARGLRNSRPRGA